MIIKDGKRQEAAQISEETKVIATAANTVRASVVTEVAVVDVVEETTEAADGAKTEVVEELGPVESVRNVCEATVTEE
ncbi:hypothetical protein PI124_g10095 [Phytophthora idaei]|nr:hypothetical protein PI125_g16911 [Phytophthora idaei]KAG3140856.1 hypothetical protein PI126_g15779 [Phytophthora idaei]KAG3245164.1 hypothetical protein PI124_g10095 [Phytophthora idaei]